MNIDNILYFIKKKYHITEEDVLSNKRSQKIVATRNAIVRHMTNFGYDDMTISVTLHKKRTYIRYHLLHYDVPIALKIFLNELDNDLRQHKFIEYAEKPKIIRRSPAVVFQNEVLIKLEIIENKLDQLLNIPQ